MPADTFVSVVIPVRNDAPALEAALQPLVELMQWNYRHFELIIVDDWSTDGSAAVVQKLLDEFSSIRLLRLARSYGRDIAITAGLEASIGDYVVIFRPACDPIEEIPQLVEFLKQSTDCALAIGLPRQPDREPRSHRLLRRLFQWGVQRITGVRLPKQSPSLLCLTRKAVNSLTRVRQKQRYLSLLCGSLGFRTAEYVYDRLPSLNRLPHRSLGEAIELGLSSLATSSTNPLRLASYAGMFAALLNLAYVGYIIGVNLFKSQVAEGWTTLSFQSSSMFFLLFAIQAIMAEYVGRILQESQDQPLYHICEDVGSRTVSCDPMLRNVLSHSTAAERDQSLPLTPRSSSPGGPMNEPGPAPISVAFRRPGSDAIVSEIAPSMRTPDAA